MNIDGRKDFQIDEAYLLLGKARYYDQGLFLRCIQLYFINTQTVAIYEAKIWRGKTNMRLGSDDALVVNNMTTLLKDQDLKNRLLLM
jgi:hypothetical protein